MSKPGKILKAMCKRLGVRLTVKRNGKRVYKSVKVLKAQCKRKQKKKKRKVKKKKVVKRRRKFGTQGALNSYYTSKMFFNGLGLPEELEREMMIDSRMTLPPQLGTSIRDSGGLLGMYRRQIEDARIPLNRQALRDYNRNLRGGAGIVDDDYFITIRNINRDYINKDLTGVDFSGLRIPMMNFTNTNFTDADLSNTIHGSNFYRNCNFQRANLQGADLEWAGFPGCNFEGATYDGNTVLPTRWNFTPEDIGMIRVNNFGKKKKKKKKK